MTPRWMHDPRPAPARVADADLFRLTRVVSTVAEQEEAAWLAPCLPSTDAEALAIVVLTRLSVDGHTH